MLKSGYSLVVMLVLNPIVILFYQNCSLSPVAQARLNQPGLIDRQVASEHKSSTCSQEEKNEELHEKCTEK